MRWLRIHGYILDSDPVTDNAALAEVRTQCTALPSNSLTSTFHLSSFIIPKLYSPAHFMGPIFIGFATVLRQPEQKHDKTFYTSAYVVHMFYTHCCVNYKSTSNIKITTREILKNNIKAKFSKNSVKCMHPYQTQTHLLPFVVNCHVISHMVGVIIQANGRWSNSSS